MPINLTKSSRKAFKLKSSIFYMLGDVLYCRGFDGILVRCLEWMDSQIAISCAHDGICGGHFSGLIITKWIICMGYYCPIMDHGCMEYVKNMLNSNNIQIYLINPGKHYNPCNHCDYFQDGNWTW